MKKNFLIYAIFLCLLASCNKSVDNVDNNIEDPPIEDSSVEGPPGSLSQIIFIAPTGDTITYNYLFDDENYLIKFWFGDYSDEYTYTRDEEKRVIKITMIGSHHTSQYARITDVYYNNDNKIAYVIDSVTRDTSKVADSLTVEYTNGSITRINTFSLQAITPEQPGKYETFEYAGSNISKIRTFYLENGFYQEDMVAYEYEYDDKINPFFTPGDIRFLGYGALSNNNTTRRTTIFNIPQPYPDVITSEYTYGSNDKPILETTTYEDFVVVDVSRSLYFYN